MNRAEVVPLWLLFGTAVQVGLNLLGAATTTLTIDLMHGVSEFALAVRPFEIDLRDPFRAIAFPAVTVLALSYVWPIIAYFRCQESEVAPEVVRRRTANAPLVLTVLGFFPWLLSAVFFPAATLYHFGHWSGDLMSQQVLSPLVNGFLVATTTYLVQDWLFRTMVVPRVFPNGHLSEVEGALTLGVRSRLLVFLLAVAFTPLFTMLGLVRAAISRAEAGIAVADILPTLAQASQATFITFVGVGIGLTLLLARTLTRPLSEAARTLRRVQAGDLDAHLQTTSGDELGILEDGVNTMVETLRDRERILQTFGRVVEPAVRDRLLAGNLRSGGEMRQVSILFCDLRGFTTLAEQAQPADVVATLNEFFSVMTAWVRECGGHVDKFVGDSLMVVFGLFEDGSADDHDPDARAALRCGIGMHATLDRLNDRRGADGRPPLAISIGVHSGEVLAGTIGAAQRHEYTVIGDTVNVAARLQQLCAERGHRLLVSETSFKKASSEAETPGLTSLDPAALRGRSTPISLFGLA